MGELPTGTVTMLFSDIEGSTVLLSRLGPAYSEALDGQRRVLREAWIAHGGTEMGTEGDSFFVVFPTAEAAIAAATQAQRALTGFPWPGGEEVRVRMGIHTGTPQTHDGGYVGMDVHLAARIAGAAHGGQVVMSSATANLVGRSLPEDVRLLDLGSHQLKDIAGTEHLFQLAVTDLPTRFPPLKTLGTAASLPRPVTPLVGREGELAELTALLRSPGVRLVTLTGPGGSGKTRLAIGLAQRLTEAFPDGVYFVPLTAVTTEHVMWTSIAEVLDVPPEGRIPPGFFDYVAHRSALLVLDNLEQLVGSDTVVTELLREAHQVVVVATSRRPMYVPGELQHAVPPLELPDDARLVEVERSGAAQLFVQHARAVRSTFVLDADNAADVAEICRRLDGLPLAIELAAARSKLLSPHALLARLDGVLDIAADGSQGPSRQHTLRDTIAWSYDLLDASQQALFRRLAVFAGGADLDAITVVAVTEGDPLDLVSHLVDASLATIDEDAVGEPRIGMLETIRAYAADQLRLAGEADAAQTAHASYYLALAGRLSTMSLSGGMDQLLEARRRFEVDHDNLREAMTWALDPDGPGRLSPERLAAGLQVCRQLGRLWRDGGYLEEGRRWLQEAIQLAGDHDSPELADCLYWLADLILRQGDVSQASTVAQRSVAMSRRLDDKDQLSAGLTLLAYCEESGGGDLGAARDALQESVALATEIGDKRRLGTALATLADLEAADGNFERSLELLNSELAVELELGGEVEVLFCRYNIACLQRDMGEFGAAREQMGELIPEILRLADPGWLITLAEDYAAVLAEDGDHQRAVRLLGAADAMRERNHMQRDPLQAGRVEEPVDRSRARLGQAVSDEEDRRGRAMDVEDCLLEAHAAGSDPD